ncbi:hypothetical protein AB6A40_005539 [Gnathostoma spinigerum]|uniref:Uncharacterized protein n=1 Tax=Gnathostoma spinigerum TaxID=75299 RepID=A0ABD6EFQ7_9BILA
MDPSSSLSDEQKRSVVIWAERRTNFVEGINCRVWRIKRPSEFGKNERGIEVGDGQLLTLQWSEILERLTPDVIEVSGTLNPFSELVEALNRLPKETLQHFFGHVQSLRIANWDFPPSRLISLLALVSHLCAFSYCDLNLSDADFDKILSALSDLQLRAVDASGGHFDRLLRNLNIELIRFCSSPGVQTTDFANSTLTSNSVKMLAAQELCFSETVPDAELFLSKLLDRFPMLEILFLDWNIVDPELVFDERSRNCADSLIKIFKLQNLKSLVVLAYTPTHESKSVMAEMIRYFSSKGITDCDWYQFGTKGLFDGMSNFSVFLAGHDLAIRARFREITCDGRNPSPTLVDFLYVLDGKIDLRSAQETFEFGGFDCKLVTSSFLNAKQSTYIS